MILPQSLRQLLLKKKQITFAEFMQQALYAPNEGYYNSPRVHIGKHGDFTTAPEISSLFGKTLARQCYPVLQHIPNASILELGAGNGTLCCDILGALGNMDALPDAYYILDVSGHLKAIQQSAIKEKIPDLMDRVHWLTAWPTSHTGIVLANEVLDAMPVRRFKRTENDILESMISLEGDTLHEHFEPSQDLAFREYITGITQGLPLPYCSEINDHIKAWMTACSAHLVQGIILFIDYGFPRHEYYHPDRNQGTIMCHWQQKVHTNPLLHVGEQDITAHVDFTHVAECAEQAGLHVAGYTNQASFLLSLGILNFLSEMDTTARIAATQAVKMLIQPQEMGELFKVLALTKNLDIPLQGFTLSDKRRSL